MDKRTTIELLAAAVLMALTAYSLMRIMGAVVKMIIILFILPLAAVS